MALTLRATGADRFSGWIAIARFAPVRSLLLLAMMLMTGPALGEAVEPEPRETDEFDLMNILAREGLHDLNEERWNAYGQLTQDLRKMMLQAQDIALFSVG